MSIGVSKGISRMDFGDFEYKFVATDVGSRNNDVIVLYDSKIGENLI